MESQETKIARMEEKMVYMTKSIDSLSSNTYEFHKKQEGQWEEMLKQWNNAYATIQKVVKIEVEVDNNSKWIQEHNTALSEIISERKDNRRRMLEYVWKFGWIILGIGASFYISYQSKTKTVEIQDDKYNHIMSLIEASYADQN